MATKRDLEQWLKGWDNSARIMVIDQAGNELDVVELSNNIAMLPVMVVEREVSE